ncbi:MAG: type II toxin-antitoxin system PemK/MazF family toxin [Coriobacteriales bacterium]|jgi:mRNA interferase MazF|nr:type II toxin-antitoxin system PemK/MazF family toxin [Coriobacteriales bacterium]
MRRFDIVIVSGGIYADKHRPGIFVQVVDDMDEDSLTVVPLTSEARDSKWWIQVDPDEQNGLVTTSYMMVNKITTVRKKNARDVVGHLADVHCVLLEQRLQEFLGFE